MAPRRRALVLVAALLVATGAGSVAPHAQSRPARIGVLESGSPTSRPHWLAAFRQGLRDLGYVEGRTVVLEPRWANGRVAELPRLAADLVRLEVDVIFAGTTTSALAARAVTDSTPIVFAVSADPVGVKLVASVRQPGGHVTGLMTGNVEITPKRLELLREVTGGKASRLGVLFNPADPSNVLALRSAQEAAGALGVMVRPVPVRSADEFEAAFASAGAERIEALMVAAGALTDTHSGRLAQLAAKARMPALYGAREFVEAGGLMSYSASFTDNYRRAAAYVDRILKGARPGDLPVEQASRFELALNLPVARALGLTIPPSLLLRADRVIE